MHIHPMLLPVCIYWRSYWCSAFLFISWSWQTKKSSSRSHYCCCKKNMKSSYKNTSRSQIMNRHFVNCAMIWWIISFQTRRELIPEQMRWQDQTAKGSTSFFCRVRFYMYTTVAIRVHWNTGLIVIFAWLLLWFLSFIWKRRPPVWDSWSKEMLWVYRFSYYHIGDVKLSIHLKGIR